MFTELYITYLSCFSMNTNEWRTWIFPPLSSSLSWIICSHETIHTQPQPRKPPPLHPARDHHEPTTKTPMYASCSALSPRSYSLPDWLQTKHFGFNVGPNTVDIVGLQVCFFLFISCLRFYKLTIDISLRI